MSNHFLTVTGLSAITNDPKILDASNGKQCILFSLATRDFYMDKNGVAQSNVTYIDAEFWNSVETIKGLNLKKGDLVEFKGKINESTWEAKESGEKRKKHFLKLKSLNKVQV